MISLKATMCIALALAMNGCGLARVYNKVTLGEPLPPGLGLTEVVPEEGRSLDDTTPRERVFGISEYYVWHTPLTTSVQTFVIHTDAGKRVTRSTYHSTTVTNCLLFLGMSSTWIMETTIPPAMVANPQEASLGDTLRGMPLNFERSKAGMRALTFTAGETQLYGFAMFVGQGLEHLWDCPLSPILEPGYSEVFIPKLGGLVTITNLGNNHLRINIQQALITDPFMLGMYAMFYLGNAEAESEQDDE